MPRLTDQQIITALKNGQIIRLGRTKCIRELLDGSKGILYVNFVGTTYWQPFNPSVLDLEENQWEIDSVDDD